jgi:hypothetical protein
MLALKEALAEGPTTAELPFDFWPQPANDRRPFVEPCCRRPRIDSATLAAFRMSREED